MKNIEHKVKKLIECGLSRRQIADFLKIPVGFIDKLNRRIDIIEKEIKKNFIINNKDYNIDKIIRNIYNNTKKRALVRKYDFDIDEKFLKNLFIKQDGCCAVTGIKFNTVDRTKYRLRPFFPSLDRINNKNGYTKKNVRFVCCAVNIALFDFGLSVFDFMVRKRAEKLYGESIGLFIKPEDADMKEPEGKKAIITRDVPAEMTRLAVCSVFSLDSDWFLVREKNGLETPKPKETIRNKNGKPCQYVYEKEEVESFFKKNIEALSFKPKLFLKQKRAIENHKKTLGLGGEMAKREINGQA